MNPNWHNASRKEACPICGHHDWCTIANDGAVCVCRRTPSAHPARSGIGWVHVLREDGGRGATRPTEWNGRALAPRAPQDFSSLHAAFEAGEGRLRVMAAALGVSVASLRALDVRYDAKKGAMSFPMRKADGTIVGLRYRNLITGEKFSARGSRDGLFYVTPGWGGVDHRVTRQDLLIVEGASDTAAAIMMGFDVVGRSSCMSGGDELVKVITARKCKHVTILADNDPPRRDAFGIVRSPGYDGARALAQRIGRETGLAARVILPPMGCKDLREALSSNPCNLTW